MYYKYIKLDVYLFLQLSLKVGLQIKSWYFILNLLLVPCASPPIANSRTV